MTTEANDITLAGVRAALQARRASAPELARHFLQRVQAQSALGAFVATDEQQALASATAAPAAGDATPLAGLPIAYQDVFATTGFDTTAGSRMLAGYRSPFDATVVQRLQQQGMVALGKLNCDEFAMGWDGRTSAAGPTRNPWDRQRTAGGAAGGAAAAVAAGLVPAAIASDTGGGIRLPSSFCGVTGLRPTYGRVSRHGLVAHASSMDQAGPVAHSAHDCALLLGAMAGGDPAHDATALELPTEDFTARLEQPLQGLRVGIIGEYFQDPLEAGVGDVLQAALSQLEQLGAQRVGASLPHAALAAPAYHVIAAAEASSSLARYDGVRFGHRAAEYADLEQMYRRSRGEGFGLEVKRRILLGLRVTSSDHYRLWFEGAQRARRLLTSELQQALESCDILAAPVAYTVAGSLDAAGDDPLAGYRQAAPSLPASLAGLPALSLPAGFDASGMPVGLQLIGNWRQEARLLQVAHQFQLATDWHTRRPEGV